MAEGLHIVGDKPVYFPVKDRAGYEVKAASPLKYPLWKVKLHHLDGVYKIEVPISLQHDLLRLPRLWSWSQ